MDLSLIAFNDMNNRWWNFFSHSCVHIGVDSITFDTNKPIRHGQEGSKEGS